MSAFLVSPKTMANVCEIVFIETRPESYEQLWDDLYTLNLRALNERYGDPVDPADIPAVTFADRANIPTEHQFLKSFDCLIYQCSEGDVIDDPLYKMLCEVRERFALKIARNSPEYERAGWDAEPAKPAVSKPAVSKPATSGEKMSPVAMALVQKKVTMTTVKSFIRKHSAYLYVKTLSRFDGMTDGLKYHHNPEFRRVETIDMGKPNTFGIASAWFVGSSRDSFAVYDDGEFAGITVYNCCGEFVLAIREAHR